MPDNIRLSNPPTISTPRGYSHIAEVTGGGRIIYISGQVALDREGNLVGDGDMAAQAEQVYQNLKAALEAVGATFENVVKMTSYIVDMSKIQMIRDVRDKYINTANPPASTAVGVTTLVHPKLLLEIEAVAVVA